MEIDREIILKLKSICFLFFSIMIFTRAFCNHLFRSFSFIAFFLIEPEIMKGRGTNHKMIPRFRDEEHTKNYWDYNAKIYLNIYKSTSGLSKRGNNPLSHESVPGINFILFLRYCRTIFSFTKSPFTSKLTDSSINWSLWMTKKYTNNRKKAD